MDVITVPTSQIKVLRYLAIYRFLTANQLVTLGVAGRRDNVYKVLRPMVRGGRPLIGKKDFGVAPKVGRLPSVYYLTRYGAQTLAEHDERPLKEIAFPKGVKLFHRDYFHRLFTIDTHIRIRQEAEQSGDEILFFDTYFDKVGSNRYQSRYGQLQAKTQVELEDGGGILIPDAVYSHQTREGKQYLTAVEICNGQDTKRIIKQVENHVKAIEQGLLSDKYGYEFANKVLFIFEFEKTKNKVEERSQLIAPALVERLFGWDIV